MHGNNLFEPQFFGGSDFSRIGFRDFRFLEQKLKCEADLVEVVKTVRDRVTDAWPEASSELPQDMRSDVARLLEVTVQELI